MFETCCIYHFRENNEKLSPGGKKSNFAEVQIVPEKNAQNIFPTIQIVIFLDHFKQTFSNVQLDSNSDIPGISNASQ